ncbi:Bacteriohemerythrin [compost metagenome]
MKDTSDIGTPPPTADECLELAWTDAMLVGHGPIDAEHQEFVEVVNALANCSADTAAACLQDLEAHVHSHFAVEKAWMEKTDFPAADCHIDEHERVIDAVQKVNAKLLLGELGLQDLRRLAKALADWFPAHAAYMDSALSAWVNKKTYGGAPVVLRRDLHVDQRHAEAGA